MKLRVDRTGILTYGRVELCLYHSYIPGDVVAVDGRLRLEVVDTVEKADGIVVLGTIPRENERYPACLCILFTHYLHLPYPDIIDHQQTALILSHPTEDIRRRTERAVQLDLLQRSIAASLAYQPQVRYL